MYIFRFFGVTVKKLYLIECHFKLITDHVALQYLINLNNTIFKLSIVKDRFMQMLINLVARSY